MVKNVIEISVSLVLTYLTASVHLLLILHIIISRCLKAFWVPSIKLVFFYLPEVDSGLL